MRGNLREIAGLQVVAPFRPLFEVANGTQGCGSQGLCTMVEG